MECPSCGARLEIDQRLALFAVCTYCNASLIVDQEALALRGKMALLRPPLGPLALGIRASLEGRRFEVLGRVRYAYAAGFWDEWFIKFDDGESAWISQDEGRLLVEVLIPLGKLDPGSLPAGPGSSVTLAGHDFRVREEARATLEAAEGQLPFAVQAGDEHPYFDLVSEKGIFGTLELEPQGARLFVGRELGADAIVIDGAGPQVDSFSPEAAATDSRRRRVVKSSGREVALTCESCGGRLSSPASVGDTMRCEHCGAQVDLRLERIPCPSCQSTIPLHNPKHASQLICPSCHARCKLSPAGLQELSQGDGTQKNSIHLTFKLGARCTFDGGQYRVVGFVHTFEYDEDGTLYTSSEYLLFSQAAGYRWLNESDGHYTLLEELHNAPSLELAEGAPGSTFTFEGHTWTVHEHGLYKIDYVEGELPWVAAAGDSTRYTDCVAPPLILTMESSEHEVTWSMGRYIDHKTVSEAFGVDLDQLPVRDGVARHQPSATRGFKRQSAAIMAIGLVLSLAAAYYASLQGPPAAGPISLTYDWYSQEIITAPFTITQAPTLCEIEISAPLYDEWVYLDIGILDDQDRMLMELSSDLSYYSGPDWSEGSNSETIVVRIEEPGEYRFLVAGQSDTTPNISISIREGVMLSRYFIYLAVFCGIWIIGVALSIPQVREILLSDDD